MIIEGVKGANVILWLNGNTSVSLDGKQLTMLQKSWFECYLDFLSDQGVDPVEQNFQIPGKDQILKLFPFKVESGWNWRVEVSTITSSTV